MDKKSKYKKDVFKSVENSRVFNKIAHKYNLKEKRVLDLGCGNGQYLINFGQGSLGITNTKEDIKDENKANLNIIIGNVEYINKLVKRKDFEIIWANNLFEHLLSPHAFLIKLKTISTPDSRLILGVPVIPRFYSLLKIRKFRGSLASNHINFFIKRTLEETVSRSGWKILESKSFVFNNFILEKIFNLFSPHIYIIAQNDTNFRYSQKKLKEWQNDGLYQELINITEDK